MFHKNPLGHKKARPLSKLRKRVKIACLFYMQKNRQVRLPQRFVLFDTYIFSFVTVLTSFIYFVGIILHANALQVKQLTAVFNINLL